MQLEIAAGGKQARQFGNQNFGNALGTGAYPGAIYPGALPYPGSPPGCPLCDASVYSYCSHKVVHDACCCDFAGSGKPPQCLYYDCALLYAKTCYEHSLIKNCCCSSPY
ncbi:uncharacterized protein LOC115629779 [Scaptodrosophila lebanonensis]|uniref:Uncharacterized protein LOC115629779 n=1 Tax=Drosophila lebanonensis TaxID=7225 RepID=A0A6J2U1G6_DROLE|nr:uncharacterized protein LOC115629779 [Scaptodrosophila lebanonensis]